MIWRECDNCGEKISEAEQYYIISSRVVTHWSTTGYQTSKEVKEKEVCSTCYEKGVRIKKEVEI